MLEVVISATALEAAVSLIAHITDGKVVEDLGLTRLQADEIYMLGLKLRRMLSEETDLHIMSKK